jgi:pimeloyl-ACP methyl ester carboxylesterase
MSLWGFYLSIKPVKLKSQTTPSDFNLNYEDVSFKTKDDLTLVGWFIPHKETNTAKTIILLHGYPADKGDILPVTRFLHEKYNLLLFDFRYLGRSEGKYTTAGARESEDLLSAIRFLKSRGINEVGVWGFSMGGSVAIMAAPEASEIKAIVSDSAYARMDWMSYELYRIPIISYPLGWLTGLWGRLFLGLDIKKVVPAESAEDIFIPILITHSEKDWVIPVEHAELLQKSLKKNPKAEFWFREEGFHGELGSEYQKRVLDFFEKNL